LSLVDAVLQLLRTLPETPKLSGTIDSLRTAQLERKKALTATLSSGISDVTEIDITVLARDGYQIPVRVYQSPNFQTGGTAAAVMLHGGGFCIGGLSNEELNCRNFVSRLGVTSFNVDYRLAPEHPYPVPVNGCWDVLKWVCPSFLFY
jgi:acetyl esterase/lipase